MIDSRFRGPAASGNGGYTCGLVAACVGNPAEVTLRLPPPLERPLRFDGRRLWDDEALVAETPIAIPLTQTLNGVTSAHASRLAAFRDRLPWSIVLLLFLGAVVPSFLMGLQQARFARPNLTGTMCFIFMVTMVIFITLDLNQPGLGTITVSQEPFERLLQSMGK